MSKLDKLVEGIRDSEAYQQLKAKYDELDSQAKLYVNLGALAAGVMFVFLSLAVSMAKLNGLKAEINEREELVGYLQRSSDSIQQLKAAQRSSQGQDTTSPVTTFAGNLVQTAGIDPGKVEIGTEHQGTQDKETIESLVDIKMSQVNLRQIQQYLFALTEQGTLRGLNIKDLVIDTKGDLSGWMDASLTLSSYKAK